MKQVKVLIFDLDDTLYPEIEFVQSGLKSVANFLYYEYSISVTSSYSDMLTILNKEGRGQVFDSVLKKHNIYSKQLVKKCLTNYRMHFPNIKLTRQVTLILKRFKKKYPIYLITDGNKIVQSNKIRALNLKSFFNKTFVTHNYGIQAAKPSLICFNKIKDIHNCEYHEMVYIGDNPYKDFINCKKVNIKTIRINQGMFKNQFLSIEYEADICINNFSQLEMIFG